MAAQNFDPRSKLALTVSVVLVSLTMMSVSQLAGLLGVFAFFVLLSGTLGLSGWLRSLAPIFYLVPFLLALNTVFYAHGRVYWSIPVGPFELALTAGGFETAVLIAVRLVLIAGVAAWFAATTSVEEFEVALVRLGLPWTLAFLMSLTIRLVPEMRHRFHVIEDAQRSRGLDLSGGPVARVRARLPMLLPFLAAVIRYGYELSEALRARGFESITERTSITTIEHEPRDYWLYLLSAGLLLVPFVV